ncbi:unnamed protein product [Parascedosporium putredinis]|uniref:Cleavage/polyadenylation specificity factor A subunit C-terminal domain-containing protein n=1 Tax=Parascedosporium putredinis TaxID=1442378 RepID=A0A9P1H9Z8_9PEZI|nr:unnamed protein product [Parascedosporium putredinis]CAI8002159.1 unnamed protein product [Parascedosporium putredinis]
MKFDHILSLLLLGASAANAVAVPEPANILDSTKKELGKRKGGGGGGARGGGGGGGSSSSSGSSRGGSGGASSGARAGAGAPRSFAGGKYYGGAFWPGLWLYGAYSYPYSHPYRFHNNTRDEEEELPVICACDPNSACGCDENQDTAYLSDLIGDGSYNGLNHSLITVAEVNGTKTILINGTLSSDTEAPSDGDESAAIARAVEALGYWPMVAAALAAVFVGDVMANTPVWVYASVPVTHSLTLPFLSQDSSNLIVAKGSLLQIFTTKAIPAEVDNAQRQQSPPIVPPAIAFESRRSDDDGLDSSLLAEGIHRADRGNNTKLVLVADKSGGHGLLVALRTAKACLVQWNPDTKTIVDTSVHFYENEEGASFELPLSEYETILQADPSSRCAAMKFGLRSIAILPLKQASADVEMDDWDVDLDGPRPVKENSDKAMATTNGAKELPYTESFVLRFPQLDPTLLYPEHFAFLYEYREPTFGILSSMQQQGYFLGRKDHKSYKVFTLDLHQRASTTILAVDNLPHDVHRVIPLPAPIGGALLVGDNELIHVDQSGRANGVSVNAFAKVCTSFPLADQSSLNLRLEHCVIEQLALESGELLMVLNNGNIAIISFKIDGRTVTGVSVRTISPECGGGIIPSRWARKHSQSARRKSRLVDPSLEYDLDDLDLDDDEDEDDLYGDSARPAPTINQGNANGQSKDGDLNFRVQDTLLSIAPLREISPGQSVFFPESEEKRNSEGVVSSLQLACAVGRGNAGAIAIINKDIQPKVIGRFEFPEARGFWTMSVQKPISKTLQAEKDISAAIGSDYGAATEFDRFMIVAKVDLDGYETSDVYAVTAAGFEALTGTEFDPAAGFTVEAGSMGKHKRVIQVLKSEVRCYDGDLGLSQIIPMLDEDTGSDPRVVSGSIADPFLLLIRDDSSVWIAQIDKNCELEEMERLDERLVSTKWLNGCLYTDVDGHFTRAGKGTTTPTILAFLVSTSGALYVYSLPDLSKPIFVAEGLAYLPHIIRRSPYLIARNSTNDLTIYQPVLRSGEEDDSKALQFLKLRNPTLAATPEPPLLKMTRRRKSRGLSRSGPVPISAVTVPSSFLAFRRAFDQEQQEHTQTGWAPRMCRQGPQLIPYGRMRKGFIYADSEGIARVTQLPPKTSFAELGVSVRKIPMGFNLKQIAYHSAMETYTVGGSVLEPFELPKDDEHRKEWARENIDLKPMVQRGQVKLVNPANWSVIQTIDYEPYEDVLCLKALNLEVSEVTKERRQLIVVGTGTRKGEDLPIRGRVYVYDVVVVIPEAGKPETNKLLKLVAKEEIPRGAVTAVSEIGTQGLMLVAQGQKCMVRGLKEDGSLLPVAFMDMSCYVTAAKELRASGLCVMADATKGVWFTGCTEEPYKMQLFGKSTTDLEIATADFLPDGKNLYLIAADMGARSTYSSMTQSVNPKSLQGHLLLHKTSFCTASNGPTITLLLPRTVTPASGLQNNGAEPGTFHNHILLLASESGMLAAISPLSEAAYRRLLSLSAQLVTALPVSAGTNPKAYRMPHPAAGAVGVDTASGRTMIDGAVLARWGELGTGRKAELAGKTGYSGVEQVRAELDSLLGWTGLAYF